LKKLALVLLLFSAVLSAGQISPRYPSDAEIRGMLAERVDIQHKSEAIVVGIITKHGRRFISYGHFGDGISRTPDADTVFELGSISKVYTGLLLCDMVEHHEVNFSDPVAKYLPASVKMPTRDGKQITLLDLAMHVSGLPRMPSNFNPKNPGNPYADYSVDQMYDFLSHYQLTRDPGAKYEYSNLGAGLLGHALALRAGTDYETLLRTRITGPLNMNQTAVLFTPEMKAQLAPGHDQGMHKAENWDIPTFAGAGGIRSTASDQLTFLAANLGLLKSPLQPAMKKMLSIRRTAYGGVAIAVGWHIFTGPQEIICHNGATGGYRSFMGFDPARKVGVIVLSNSSNDVDDIARRILSGYVAVHGPVRQTNTPWPAGE
jgi:D-alanyl-D-alanine-carboxypeptidase/D-alanyl-D-alanine-endopeptidase